MRLKPFDHAIAIILILLMLALSVCLVALAWMPDLMANVFDYAEKFIAASAINPIIVTVAGALLAFLCVRVLFVRRRREARPRPDVVADGIMLRNGEHGTSYITIKAIDAMVKKHVRANAKVRDCKVAVQPTDDQQNLNLRLQLVLAPDVPIPEACSELQESLSKHIQEMTGVVCKEVRVTVDDSTEAPNAVKARTVK